ncbi:MAG TPA: imidazole glycerol phosphate synthase subunit HisH [Polyangia bacterium]|jgi:glutamine amidotransferase
MSASDPIALCDLGLGNLRSVEKALAHVGGAVVRTADPEVVRRAAKVVIPGQGAFHDCMGALGGGLGEAVRAVIDAGRPYLGICLGMQVLFDESDEHGVCRGLGVLPGRVVRLPGGAGPDGRPLKVPHMGWSSVRLVRAAPLTAGLPPEPYFYFVHSYYAAPADPDVVAIRCTYGVDFAVAVARDNLFACQFHPEKSGAVGLGLLARFVAL